MEQHGLHITVAAYPDSTVSIQTDLMLLKAALLYADKVTLCSTVGSYLMDALAAKHRNPEQQMDWFKQKVSPVPGFDMSQLEMIISSYKTMHNIPRRQRTPQIRALIKQTDILIKKAYLEGMGEINKLANNAGLPGLQEALRSGIVELEPLDVTTSQDAINSFFSVISKAVASGTSYPMFDDQTGSLINAAVKEGKISPSQVHISRGKHVGLAGDLIRRLPLFEEATIDEIIQIRRALEKPLIHFRAAMVEFSKMMENASWDDNFSLEVDEIFIQKISPSVHEIEEAVRSGSFLKTLIGNTLNNKLLMATFSLNVGISQLHSLPDLLHVALPALNTVEALPTFYNSVMTTLQNKRKLEQNQLFFYCAASKKLKESAKYRDF